MNILITGGAGFIGSHLAAACLARGYRVHIIDNLCSGFRHNVPPGAAFHEYDIQDARAAELVRAQRFDAIFHQAAQLDVRKSVADPLYDAQVNILGSLNLLQAAAGHCGKFLFASSGGTVYGEQHTHPADEAHSTQPMSPYGVTKLSVEKYLYFYQQTYGLPCVALRYANVYGPRQSPHGEAGVVAIFIQKMLAGVTPVINGDGLQTRDYVYIDDVVQANLRALDADQTGAFNIGVGVETTVVDIFTALNAAFGGGFNAQHGPGREGEQRRSVLHPGLAERALGWRPQVAFDEGLARTLAWFRAQATDSRSSG